VTVCIAAICNDKLVFGAADQMLSTQDVEFEPPSSKIIPITAAISLMTAGDSAIQSEIIEEMRGPITERINKEPKNWWRIKDVTEQYIQTYNAAKLKRAEAAILAPLGLNKDTFVSRQRDMSDKFITTITREMLHYELPPISTIITGIDDMGPHIYVVHECEMHCNDKVGFAAIGVGARHAESELMNARHTRSSPIDETFWLVFKAKKRAEIAPGVGRETDVVMLGPQLGTTVNIDKNIIADFDRMYTKNADKEKEMQEQAQEDVRLYFDKLAESAQEKEQKLDDLETDGQ